MSITHTTITEDEFLNTFRPETDAQGSTYVQREWFTFEEKRLLEEMHGKNRLWTMVEDDNGNPCLVQGYHYVNRLYYVICEVPYPGDVEYNVEMVSFDNDEYCEDCNEPLEEGQIGLCESCQSEPEEED